MPREKPELTFAGACTRIEKALTGTARANILAGALQSADFKSALRQLRAGMRSNTWETATGAIALDPIISRYDGQMRRAGFHALHDWDGIADKVNDDIIPVDVLNFLIDQRGEEPCDSGALAILLD